MNSPQHTHLDSFTFGATPKKKLFKNIKELFDFVHIKKSTCNILFSPGYPSGDDFKDFNERGEIFNMHAISK